MRKFLRLRSLVFPALLLSLSCAVFAQDHDDRDRGRDNPGHGGMPPGQAKKAERGLPPGQEKRYEEGRGLPPGIAKKYFRDEDRDHFYGYYRNDVERWRGRNRPMFAPGQVIARTYVVRTVPQSYWVNVVAPPPPGYRYGYCNGYVVAYNPTTRVIADVLDLVNAARGR